jgi:hypothetical protein
MHGKALHVPRDAHGYARASGPGIVGHQVDERCGNRFDARLLGIGFAHASQLLERLKGWLAAADRVLACDEVLSGQDQLAVLGDP